MNARELKGRDLARRGMVERRDDGYWSVVSQSGGGKYLVDVEGEPPTCTCPDYDLEQICKRLDRRAASSGVPARVNSLDACLIFLRFAVSQLKCKHIYAVEFVRRGMPDDDCCAEKPRKPTYR